MNTTLRPGLPPLPGRWSSLPIDDRGFPVPFFVAYVDGKPDHRVVDPDKFVQAINLSLCWLCGQKLGAYRTFCIGPMCCVTRTISEPPSHLECARYAVRTCPWLTRPHAKRREAGLPDGIVDPAGVGLKRNPGATCLWTCKSYSIHHNDGRDGSNKGYLFTLSGEPTSLEWYAEGRLATRAEVDESIRTGLPLLEKAADEDDAHNDQIKPSIMQVLSGKVLPKGAARAHLASRVESVRKMLDRVLPA